MPSTLLSATVPILASALLVTMGPAKAVTPVSARATTVASSFVTGLATTSDDSSSQTITLLSGDTVVLRPGPVTTVVRIEPGPGREGVGFMQQQINGALYVIPDDAAAAIARGIVDRRLFDVTRLLREGDDDGSRATLPVLVQYAGGLAGVSARTKVRDSGAEETRHFDDLDISAVSVEQSAATTFWTEIVATPGLSAGTGRARSGLAPGIARVWLDATARVLLDVSVPQIGAPTAWAAGLTGADVKVAVLDTGYDPTHPDLQGRIAASKNFTTEASVTDHNGHGTHVASTLAGSGAASDGRYRGVAPDTDLLIAKVCDRYGQCRDSAILAGMQWAADQGARILSLSIGGRDEPGLDPLEKAVGRLTDINGMLFVVAAGNQGSAPATISSPGSADAALTVGAVDDSDHLATFSSRGPRIVDEAIKPDLTAPGVNIVAARASRTLPDDAVNEYYASLSGTSMATPHVAGAAAILAQQHPNWQAAQLKAALTNSAAPMTRHVFNAGSGRVDVASAFTQHIYASPTNLSFGLHKWPHADDQRVTKTITYRNTSSVAVTLDLTLKVAGPTGRSTPPGMFTAPSHVVVPSKGTIDAPVLLDTGVAARNGIYSAVLSARGIDANGGTIRLRTPVAVDREPESYDLTIKALDRNGEPVTTPFLALAGLDTGEIRGGDVLNGTAHLRLPAGRWNVALPIEDNVSPGSPKFRVTYAAANVALTRDRTVVLDARHGKPVRVAKPEAEARLATAEVGVQLTAGNDKAITSSGLDVGPTAGQFRRVFAIPTTSPTPGLTFFTHSQWAKPNRATFADSPYLYNIYLPTPGAIPAKLDTRVNRTDLATVNSRFRATRAGNTAIAPSLPSYDGFYGGYYADVPLTLPQHRTDYYSTADGTIAWDTSMQQFHDNKVDLGLQSILRTYLPGEHYRQAWAAPVFGPGLPKRGYPYVFRVGNTIDVRAMPMLSDSNPRHHSTQFAATSQTFRLFRDGIRIEGTRGVFEVPPGPGTYRLVAKVRRDAAFSRSVKGEWSFTSSQPPQTSAVPLPVTAVRYAPKPDNTGRGPAGVHALSMIVQRQGQRSEVTGLSLEVSYDGGRTWKNAEVNRTRRRGWNALIENPPGLAKWVSLRSTVTDAAGGTSKQTIRHAYREP